MDVRLVTFYKVGDRVRLASNSKYFNQFDGLGTITEVNHTALDEGDLFVYSVTADSGYSNRYRHEDLILVRFDKIRVMADIASDPVLVNLLRKWNKGPIGECPYNYGSVKRNCSKLCYALFPGTGPDCPCDEPSRKETVEMILAMADFAKVKTETVHVVGSLFVDSNQEVYLLVTVDSKKARIVAIDGTGFWGDPLTVDDKREVHFPDGFLDGLTFRGIIHEEDILKGCLG